MVMKDSASITEFEVATLAGIFEDKGFEVEAIDCEIGWNLVVLERKF